MSAHPGGPTAPPSTPKARTGPAATTAGRCIVSRRTAARGELHAAGVEAVDGVVRRRDLDWLFVTSIRPPAPRDAAEPLAGSLLAFRPGVNGCPKRRTLRTDNETRGA
jgi:hypothetical protein